MAYSLGKASHHSREDMTSVKSAEGESDEEEGRATTPQALPRAAHMPFCLMDMTLQPPRKL